MILPSVQKLYTKCEMLWVLPVIIMTLEITIFTFKITVPFEEWAKGFDSSNVYAMHMANGGRLLSLGVSKDHP